jgi:REP element-mobilizing transposase RayT
MSNHIHILLEVPPMPAGGISDAELLKRLSAIQTEAFVATVAKELYDARKAGNAALVAEIHARFTYRMHDLSEFMKTVLQRFTRWFNRNRTHYCIISQTNCMDSPCRRGYPWLWVGHGR